MDTKQLLKNKPNGAIEIIAKRIGKNQESVRRALRTEDSKIFPIVMQHLREIIIERKELIDIARILIKKKQVGDYLIVAKAAGISHQNVSKVLSRPKSKHFPKCVRILEAIITNREKIIQENTSTK